MAIALLLFFIIIELFKLERTQIIHSSTRKVNNKTEYIKKITQIHIKDVCARPASLPTEEREQNILPDVHLFLYIYIRVLLYDNFTVNLTIKPLARYK